MAGTDIGDGPIHSPIPEASPGADPAPPYETMDAKVEVNLEARSPPKSPKSNEDKKEETNAQASTAQTQTPETDKTDPGTALARLKLGKQLDLVANILEQELGELPEEHLTETQTNFNRQIEVIRRLAKGFTTHETDGNSAEGSAEVKEDPNDGPKCETKMLSMDDWTKQNFTTSVITAFYRGLLPFDGVGQDKEHEPKGRFKDRQDQPQRVLLTSEVLVDEIEDISGVTTNTYAPILLAPPFKILTKYYPEMIDRLSQLEGELQQLDNKIGISDESLEPASQEGDLDSPVSNAKDRSTNSGQDLMTPTLGTETSKKPESSVENPVDTAQGHRPSLSGASIVNESSKTEKTPEMKRKELALRIDHLRLLKDFIKTELGYYVDLQQRIKAGIIDKIAFEDLWYLFQPGETLFFKHKPQDQAQLCIAYAITGGQLRKRARTRLDGMYADDPRLGDGGYDATMNTSGAGTWSRLTIDYYTMEFNGDNVGPSDGSEHIKHYAGEKSITDLPIYPVRFHKHKDDIVSKLVSRGRKYLDSLGHKSYSGFTSPALPKQSSRELRGDVFVDFKEYYYTARIHRPMLGMLQRTYEDISEVEEVVGGQTWCFCDHEVDQKAADKFLVSKQSELEPLQLDEFPRSEDRLQLFPHIVPAYVFRTREYVHIDIDAMTDIDKSDEARMGGFKELVIPESHRELLIGLVRNQVSPAEAVDGKNYAKAESSAQIDIVRGKGQGLIILLHGPPGSGKTSTAETLAAYTRRPLYPITCGDLGTEPVQVEEALVEHTERAQKWGCILLLDEADVFLAQRTWRDTNHNALVSVFLRQLEYYSGILFLTTNRVGVMDEAFKSRIHVSLAYPTIELQETENIWKGILDRLERNNKTEAVKVKFDRDALILFARKHYKQYEKAGSAWNGRQIRNAFQLAIALGHHERDKALAEANLTDEQAAQTGEKKWMTVKLRVKNFRNIADTARDFEDYLHSVRGSDTVHAKDLGLRDDEHSHYRTDGMMTPAKKEYSRNMQQSASPRLTRETSSPFSTPARDRQREREIKEQDRPSASQGRRRGRKIEPKEEDENSGLDEKEDDEEIIEELEDDD